MEIRRVIVVILLLYYCNTSTEIAGIDLFAFVHRLFHEDFSPIDGIVNWREIFMKQSVDKYK